MSKTVAFLKILNPDNVPCDLDEILAILEKIGFKNVKPFEKYTPNSWDHRFLVWRFNEKDRLTDEEALQIVGKNGNVLYKWICPRCTHIVSKCENPGNHINDTQFGCMCSTLTHHQKISRSAENQINAKEVR
jgi:hypothetical protein